jgi:hypothetical protein
MSSGRQCNECYWKDVINESFRNYCWH